MGAVPVEPHDERGEARPNLNIPNAVGTETLPTAETLEATA